MGAVGFPGNPRASSVATRRGTAPVGSTDASVPPQATLRKGEPSVSSSATIATVIRIGRRMTLIARW